MCSGESSGLPLGLSHKEPLLTRQPKKVPVPPIVLIRLSIFYCIYAFGAHHSAPARQNNFTGKAGEAFCALCTAGTAFFPLQWFLTPTRGKDTTALLTSCHTEEHSHSFAHHRLETHNPWNLYPVEVALNFRNSRSSCYRLQKRNTGTVLHRFHSWPTTSHQRAQQGTKRPCLAKSVSTVKLVWCPGAESASGKRETSYPGHVWEQREAV